MRNISSGTMSSVSVLTIVSGRTQALQNLIAGLERNSMLPDELIIVHMNEPVINLRSEFFNIKSFSLITERPLPLAEARNYAVEQSVSSHMIFLDVDCIPAENLVRLYFEGFAWQDCLWTGPVRYLREFATETPEFIEKLEELSTADPIRGGLHALPYELFWSLNFGCSRKVFDQIGGFDPAFQGYGGEDTDFSFMSREKGIPIAVTSATAYHQFHPSYDPPLNHFEDIIINATSFHEKWQIWPMEGWLNKFEDLGLIERGELYIKTLRFPTQLEISLGLKSL